MPMALDETKLEAAAKKAEGNWKQFSSFVWWRGRQMEDAGNYAIYYTHHRESGLIDHSNAAVIAKAIEAFTEGDDPDATAERHNHWAVGWIEGYSIRVFRDGHITDAFRTYHALAEQMDQYPILDESDYSEREFDATLQNIDLAAWKLKKRFVLPKEWASDVYSWLIDQDNNALENTDDQGGWPDEEDLEAAFESLGFQTI
jgi:hypothetical protein